MKYWLISYFLWSVSSATIAANLGDVSKALQEGEQFLVGGRYEKALDSCRFGLKSLGDAYSSPEVIDDTDQKLMAAELLERDGKLDNAASLTCRILRSRFELWKVKNGARTKRPNHSFNADELKRAG